MIQAVIAQFPQTRVFLTREMRNAFIGSLSEIYTNAYIQSLGDNPDLHIVDIDALGFEAALKKVRALLSLQPA